MIEILEKLASLGMLACITFAIADLTRAVRELNQTEEDD